MNKELELLYDLLYEFRGYIDELHKTIDYSDYIALIEYVDRIDDLMGDENLESDFHRVYR